jgi:hypothetical protein
MSEHVWPDQGDQIGRIFVCWAIVYGGRHFKISTTIKNFWAVFITKSYVVLILTKNVLGDTLGVFFTSSSGHPGPGVTRLAIAGSRSAQDQKKNFYWKIFESPINCFSDSKIVLVHATPASIHPVARPEIYYSQEAGLPDGTYIFIPKIPICSHFGMENVDIFGGILFGHLVYVMAICYLCYGHLLYMLWPFVIHICYGHLVYVMAIWYMSIRNIL